MDRFVVFSSSTSSYPVLLDQNSCLLFLFCLLFATFLAGISLLGSLCGNCNYDALGEIELHKLDTRNMIQSYGEEILFCCFLTEKMSIISSFYPYCFVKLLAYRRVDWGQTAVFLSGINDDYVYCSKNCFKRIEFSTYFCSRFWWILHLFCEEGCIFVQSGETIPLKREYFDILK